MSTSNMSCKQQLLKEGVIIFPHDGQSSPHLLGSKCTKCGKVYFPTKNFCSECMNETMEDTALSNEGVLYASTVVYIGVKGFATPYVLGWVDIPSDKVRVVTQIEYDPQKASELHSGRKLELVIGKLKTLTDGTEIVGYKYKPTDMKGGQR